MKKNIILCLSALATIGISYAIGNQVGEFNCVDNTAKDMVSEISPDFEPWAEKSLWQPPWRR